MDRVHILCKFKEDNGGSVVPHSANEGRDWQKDGWTVTEHPESRLNQADNAKWKFGVRDADFVKRMEYLRSLVVSLNFHDKDAMNEAINALEAAHRQMAAVIDAEPILESSITFQPRPPIMTPNGPSFT